MLGIVVRDGKPRRKLHVTPITTLIAARVGLHRSVPRAEREIRTLLRLPSWHDLYGDVRHDARAFDGSRFVRAAQRNGGLDRYVERIGRLVGRRRVAFRGAATKPRAGELRWVGSGDDDVKTDIDWLVDNAVACKAGDLDADCDTYIPENKRATRWCSVTLPQLDDEWRRGDPSLEPAQTTCSVIAHIKTRVLDKSGFNTWDTDIVGNGRSGGVLPTYQALAYVDTKRSGFVTQGYHDELKLVGAQIAWKTLLIASYAVEYERMDTANQRRIQHHFDTAIARIGRQTALLPPRLPENTAIDPRTGLMWSVLDNPAKACGGDRPWPLGWEYAPNAWTRTQAEVQASLCEYLRLDDGAVRELCVAAFRNLYADPNRLGLPCNAPSNAVIGLDLSRYSRSGPLSFGHPLVWLVKRDVGAQEAWFRAP